MVEFLKMKFNICKHKDCFEYDKRSFFFVVILTLILLTFIISSLPAFGFLPGSGQNRIVGQWIESNGKEIIQFYQDGTVTMKGTILSFSGDYRYIDDHHIRIELGGLAALAGPRIYQVEFRNSNLYLTDMKGVTSIYLKDKGESPSARILKNKIFGIWLSTDGSELVQFFQDGTISIARDNMPLSGQFEFINDDHLRIKLAGLASLTGIHIYRVVVTEAQLTTIDGNDNVQYYQRMNSQEASEDFHTRILGKWIADDNSEIFQFFKDGTVGLVSGIISVAGNYQFIANDFIKLDLHGFRTFTGPVIMQIYFSENKLVLTTSTGTTFTYQSEPEEIEPEIKNLAVVTRCNTEEDNLRYGIYIHLFEPLIDLDLKLTYNSIENVEEMNEYYDKLLSITKGLFLLESLYNRETLTELSKSTMATIGYTLEVFEINDYLPIIFDSFLAAFETLTNPDPISVARYAAENTFSIVNNLIAAVLIWKKTQKLQMLTAIREIMHSYYKYCHDFKYIQEKYEIDDPPGNFQGDLLTFLTVQYLRDNNQHADTDYISEVTSLIIMGVNSDFRKLQNIESQPQTLHPVLLEVPTYDQDNFGHGCTEDCSPVAAAMVLGWYDSHGWPALVPGGPANYRDNPDGVRKLVMDLWKTMEYTCYDGTAPTKVAPGIVTTASNMDPGAKFIPHSIVEITNDNKELAFRILKGYIDNSRPVLFSSFAGLKCHYTYDASTKTLTGGHSMVMTGYLDSKVGRKIFLNSGWTYPYDKIWLDYDDLGLDLDKTDPKQIWITCVFPYGTPTPADDTGK